MRLRSAIAGLFALLVLTLLLATKPDYDTGDFLLYARSTDSTTLDPQEMGWGEDIKVAECIFETLVKFAEEPPGVEPLLAERWETSPDGRTVTFHLRKGIRFHDGTPFNSAAVKFALMRLLDDDHRYRPKDAVYATLYQEVIEKIETPDDFTVVFRLKGPSPIFLQLMAVFPSFIPSPASVEKHDKLIAHHPTGTGPYRLTEWRSTEKIVLTRDETYWGAKPALERIIFLQVQNPQTAILKLQYGEVHMMDHATLADIKPIREDPELKVLFAPNPNVAYLAFNTNEEAFPYCDIHFRRAVSLALDRNVLNELVYYGLADHARNIVPPSLWPKDWGELPPYEHSLEKAKEELARVDLPKDFVVELWHMNFARDYMPEPHKVGEWVKDQLARVGLEVKIQNFEKAIYSTKNKDPKHPMCLSGWMADYPDPDNFLKALLHGQGSGTLNITFWNDPEFNRLTSEAAVTMDPKKRGELYFAASKLYRDQVPSLALVHTRRIIAVRNNIRYKPHPIDYRLYTVSIEKK